MVRVRLPPAVLEKERATAQAELIRGVMRGEFAEPAMAVVPSGNDRAVGIAKPG